MKILGVDYGDRKQGFALSDEMEMIAFPHSVVVCKSVEEAVDAVVTVSTETGAGKIIVGMPINMDGSHGPRAEKTQAFIERLKSRLAMPIETWDERLTTKSAEDVLIQAGTRREKRKKVIDKLAAQIMLQHYLDAKSEPMLPYPENDDFE